MPDSLAHFINRISAERRLLERYRNLTSNHAAWLQEPQPEVESELDDIADEISRLTGDEAPEEQGRIFMFGSAAFRRVQHLVGRMLQQERLAWELESEVSLGEWGEHTIQHLSERGLFRACPGTIIDALPCFHFRHFRSEVTTMILDSANVGSPLELADLCVRSILREAGVERPTGLDGRFWNRARAFNAQRVLSLRIRRLSVSGMPDGASVTLEFSNLNEALALPEQRRRSQTTMWPSHPTLPVPWRCMSRAEDGSLREESLGVSLTDALVSLAKMRVSLESWMASGMEEGISAPEEMTLEAAVSEVFESERWNLPGHPTVNDFVFAPDSPDLPVVSCSPLASGENQLALKAREIWFQRFRDVLLMALPESKMGTLFLLEHRKPRSPFRTFVAKLPRDLSRVQGAHLSCPECGRPCDVVVNLNFTHHDLKFRLPGCLLLLFICSEHSDCGEGWRFRWVGRDARDELSAILENADACLAGPAVRVVEYDQELVDWVKPEEPSPLEAAFADSWEKSYMLYASSGTKVGGGVFWIQGDPGLMDSAGQPMHYIGQVGCNEFLNIGDSGIAYILHSPATGETSIRTQYY